MSSIPTMRREEAAVATAQPLAVDLDGTLIKSDLLLESANQFVTHNPLQALRVLGWLAAGRSTLKARLAEQGEFDASVLPYNEQVVDWLRQQKQQGRTLILATASHRRLAEAVATHLGLFDEVLATEEGANLKGEAKRDRLVERFGERHFDYIGNDEADLPVWAAADHAHVVGASAAVLGRARSLGNVGTVFDDRKKPAFRSLAKAMRLHQWVKNFLIFVPLLAAHRYDDYSSLVRAALAFIAFALTASSVYLLNDLVDLADDRHHASKRRRPLASGELSLLYGWFVWPVLLMSAFALAATAMPPIFVAVLAGYFALTLAYSFRLKRVVMVDVLSLAILYTLRIIAGAAAVAVPLSFWLLAFSTFVFLSLAFMKRFSELKVARGNGRQGNIRGRGYQPEDLELVSSFGTSAAYVSVLVLALYIQDSRTAQLYHQPKVIWLACPVLLFWLSRAWLIAHRGQMHDDPIVFALKDRLSWLVGGALILVFALATLL